MSVGGKRDVGYKPQVTAPTFDSTKQPYATMIAQRPSFLIEEGASGTKPLSEWLAGKEFLSKLES